MPPNKPICTCEKDVIESTTRNGINRSLRIEVICFELSKFEATRYNKQISEHFWTIFIKATEKPRTFSLCCKRKKFESLSPHDPVNNSTLRWTMRAVCKNEFALHHLVTIINRMIFSGCL